MAQPLGCVDTSGVLPRVVSEVPRAALLIDMDGEGTQGDATTLFSPGISNAIAADDNATALGLDGLADEPEHYYQDGTKTETELEHLSCALPLTHFLCLLPAVFAANAGIVFRSKLRLNVLTGQVEPGDKAIDTWPCILRIKPETWAASMTSLAPGCRLVSINGVAATSFEAAKAQLAAAKSAATATATDPFIKLIWEKPAPKPPAAVAALRAGLTALQMVHRHESRLHPRAQHTAPAVAEATSTRSSATEANKLENTTSAEKRRRAVYTTEVEADQVRAEFELLPKRSNSAGSSCSAGSNAGSACSAA